MEYTGCRQPFPSHLYLSAGVDGRLDHPFALHGGSERTVAGVHLSKSDSTDAVCKGNEKLHMSNILVVSDIDAIQVSAVHNGHERPNNARKPASID